MGCDSFPGAGADAGTGAGVGAGAGLGAGGGRVRESIFAHLALGRVLLDDTSGLLVIQPDVLVSPTKIAESLTCTRRAVITDRVRGFGGTSKPAVLGNLRHAFVEGLVERVLGAVNEWGE
ncbi:DNA replication factor Dna2-domain-containing protein, partial [Ochromonadaceae sp. CCMP2298]